VGRRWLGPPATTVLVALCAVNGALLRYSDEAKHYSADAFCVLLLLTLAALAVERPSARRVVVWWLVAAACAWFSFAAVLATPGIALVLLASTARRRVTAWIVPAAGALAWLAAVGLLHLLSLRFAVGDETLLRLNARLGLPPEDGDMVAWLARRPFTLAKDPFGVPAWFAVPLWAGAAAGAAVAARRHLAFGALLAVPPVTAFALAQQRIVPLYGRFALWLVPPMCVALAVAARALAAWAVRRPAPTLPRAIAVGLAGAAAVVALAPAGLAAARPPVVVNGVDDRAAIRFLLAERRPGDLLVVGPSSWPAVGWYAGPGTLATVRVAALHPDRRHCPPPDLRPHTRVLAWSGARSSGRDLDGALFAALSEVGRVVRALRFDGGVGVLYVADLTAGPRRPPGGGPCVTFAPHRR
jgi:hypothetical protein